jgi:hypothetical protein
MPAISTLAAGSAKAYGNLKFRPFPARYFILQITGIKNSPTENIVQISEFNIMNGASRVSTSSYYNWNLSFLSATGLSDSPTSPGGEEPYKANDANVSTKWLDFRGTSGGLWIDLGSNQESTGYQWYTANDGAWRDPAGWKVWVSQDDKTWYLASQVSGFYATDSRFSLAGSWNWIP